MDIKDTDGSKRSYTPSSKFVIIVLAILLIATITSGSVILSKNSCNSDRNGDVTIDSTSIGPDNMDGRKTLRLVSREEWLAQPPIEPLDKLASPVDRVIIGHSATNNCSTQVTCILLTRIIQNFHMQSSGLSDIGYNFLVGGDGYVYEGRGWDIQGAHTRGYNMNSIGIIFIGTFTILEPPEKQLNAAKLLIEEGVRLKKLQPNYRLYGSRQLAPTESPGSKLFSIIKSWPNWSSSV